MLKLNIYWPAVPKGPNWRKHHSASVQDTAKHVLNSKDVLVPPFFFFHWALYEYIHLILDVTKIIG